MSLNIIKNIFFICIINYFVLLIPNNNVPELNDLKLISIDTLLKINPHVLYQKCHDPVSFNLKPFPIPYWESQHPKEGTFAETFILTIPYGNVCSEYGHVIIDQKYVLRELILPNDRFYHSVNLMNENKNLISKKIPGRVAVITRRDAGTYGHWIIDILGRIALLEIMGVDFDWIYIPYYKSFMKETLTLWGIDSNKIIEPTNDCYAIQADELIVPSLVSRRVPTPNKNFSSYTPLSVYYPVWAVEYIRNKFLPFIQNKINKNFNEKIFISRKDSCFRNIENEDEVFKEFENYGFVRYELSKLSFLEQLELFHHAKVIASPNGSGLSNIMFCNKNTKILEIFQARADSSFYNLAQVVGLQYNPIFTTSFHEIGFYNTYIPIEIIKNFIEKYNFK